MVSATLLLVLAGACPDGCVGTATAAAYREASITWRQNAKNERSAHKTTREALAVCFEERADTQGQAAAAAAAGVSRGSRIALAVAGVAAGAGAAVGGAGLLEGNDAVAGVGLVTAGVAAVAALVVLLVDP